jgi:hypothetical protein
MYHEPRGSVWRRWDLHVHTPASTLLEFGDPAEDATWSSYATALLAAARAHEIAAICLADYFTLDGYEALVEKGYYDPGHQLLRVGDESEPLLILPGIELRLSHFTLENHLVNVHVFFDPRHLSTERLRSDFLGQLSLDPEPGSQELKASRAHILALGKSAEDGSPPDLNQDLSGLPSNEQQGLWRKGLDQASVNLAALKKVLSQLDKTVPGGRSYLLAIAKTGHGGLDELAWEGHPGMIKQSLMREADLLFSSRPDDREFLLGLTPDTPPSECVARFGGLMPCVWGSDAKNLDTLLHPSNGKTRRYCWIKADLTFEGLKQLVFEPAERVLVQEADPDQRAWHHTIDAVRFIDDTRGDIVPDEWISINPALTSIIGGKSAGKSLLLYFIAKTIDPVQVRERHGEETAPYDRLEQDVSLQVRWKNGDIQTLGGAEVAPSRITYLPQSYINQLAEPGSQEQLEEVILRLLKEDSSFAEAEEQLRRSVDSQATVVQSQLQRAFELRRQVDTVVARIRDLGNVDAIQAEIDRLEKELTTIREAAGMSEEEQTAFTALRERNARVEEAERQLQVEIEQLSDLEQDLSIVADRLLEDIGAYGASADAEVDEDRAVSNDTNQTRIQVIAAQLAEDIQTAFRSATDAIVQAKEEVSEQTKTNQSEKTEIEKALEPFNQKLESGARAEALAQAQTKQRASLATIQEETQRSDRLVKRLSEAQGRAVSAYRGIHSAYLEFLGSHLAQGVTEIAEDIELTAEVFFDAEAFSTQIQEALDGRQRLEDLSGLSNLGDLYEFPGIDDHCGNLDRILAELTGPESERKLKLKKSYSPNDVAVRVFRDFFKLRLGLTHDGDDLPRMSPGKRGMVLLRLLLEHSRAIHPILIDQPEDNLDNRTVFTELRHAIRSRKKARQILIVSHNANLVVATDSDCVLVAHQYGIGEQPDSTTRFEYRGGALEHTYGADPTIESVLARQGTKEHVCEILEGGEEAFVTRQQKYEFGTG